MYILLALIAACVLGIAAHFALPGREVRGVALTPALATALSAIAYTGLQWLGIGEDSIWLWLASVIGAVVVAAAVAATISGVRRRTDAEAKTALGI